MGIQNILQLLLSGRMPQVPGMSNSQQGVPPLTSGPINPNAPMVGPGGMNPAASAPPAAPPQPQQPQQNTGVRQALGNMLNNPQMMLGISQLLGGMGKYGGYRAQGMQKAYETNAELGMRQKELANQEEWRKAQERLRGEEITATNKRIESQERIAGAKAKDKEFQDLAKDIVEKGWDVNEAMLPQFGVNDPVDQQRVLAIVKTMKQAEEKDTYYIDTKNSTNPKEWSVIRPGEPVDPTKPGLYKATLKKDGPPVRAMNELKKLMGIEEPTQAETTDRDKLAWYAEANKLDVSKLTPAQKAEARLAYSTKEAGGRAEATSKYWPGQNIRLSDSSGQFTGLYNAQTKTFTPAADVPEGSYQGGTGSIPATTSEQLSGMKTALDLLVPIESEIRNAKVRFGPVTGRITLAEISKLGGLGASPEEIKLAQDLYRIVTSQAFANGGKQLTITELARFERSTPQLSDTIEQALIKTNESTQFLRTALANRILGLPPRSQGVIDPAIKKAAGLGGDSGTSTTDKVINFDDKGNIIKGEVKP